MDTYIKIFCLVFLALSKLYKSSLNTSVKDQLQAAIICAFLALAYIIIIILHSLNAFRNINIQDMIAMVFILTYNDSIRRASGRMIQIAIESMEVLIVFASVLLAFACMARILFFGIFYLTLKTLRSYTRTNSITQATTTKVSPNHSTQ
jgi:hypothetical protein